ncbi:MAG: 3-phosphoshikimate 1-carboxyvinyltransferase [Bacteroidales bacterium]
MIYQISAPDRIHTRISLPASKSISNRALILNALSYSPYLPENLSDCDDTQVMIKAFDSDSATFDIGAAGTSMRFLTAFLSKIGGVWEITGSERMQNRPIGILVDALRQCGAQIEYLTKEGYPPLKITGRALRGGQLTLNGGISSQYISALLMIAPTMMEGLTLHLTGKIISTPYIRMTLGMLAKFGIESEWQGDTIHIRPQEFRPIHFKVESDWSAASYWYEIASLCDDAEILLTGLERESLQGDARIAEFFIPLGVTSEFTSEGVILRQSHQTAERLDLDLSDQPDLAQTLVVTCVLKGIPFCFTGLESLKIKETDRIVALRDELRKLGFRITDRDDCILEWNGERCDIQADAVIATYEDHRMAMAFAPVALVSESVFIAHPQVVSKSYPAYWDHLQQAGFKISSLPR